MKSINLTNQDLSAAILFLKSLSMGGKPTRGKQTFISRLVDKNKEYGEQEKEIVTKYSELDEEGEVVVVEGMYHLRENITEEESLELFKLREELSAEEVVISFGEYSDKYNSLFNALDNWATDIAPEHSFIYDKLMNEFEKEEK